MLPVWVKGTLMLGLTFTAGVLAGVSYERRRPPAHHDSRADAQHVLGRLRDQLGLDSGQERTIAAILARRQQTVDSTWHLMQSHVYATMDSAHQEILRVLRPDQAAKYRSLVGRTHAGTPP